MNNAVLGLAIAGGVASVTAAIVSFCVVRMSRDAERAANVGHGRVTIRYGEGFKLISVALLMTMVILSSMLLVEWLVSGPDTSTLMAATVMAGFLALCVSLVRESGAVFVLDGAGIHFHRRIGAPATRTMPWDRITRVSHRVIRECIEIRGADGEVMRIATRMKLAPLWPFLERHVPAERWQGARKQLRH